MIAFTIEEAENEVDCARAQRALTVALMQRTRACDTKGWLGERIAVILPYTTVAGARGLVQKIDALFYENYQESGSAAGNASLSCAMYEYPADRIDAMTAKPQE
ncbi:MAG: hypothetical protein IT366_08400 [Candidatus Hydrogenedentes bacterium]|nr:hypothetical protein [Candidatus Hydrogenedentota bacterium]